MELNDKCRLVVITGRAAQAARVAPVISLDAFCIGYARAPSRASPPSADWLPLIGFSPGLHKR